MNISSACGSPVPKTICLRPSFASLQRWQSGPMSSAMTCRSAARSRLPSAVATKAVSSTASRAASTLAASSEVISSSSLTDVAAIERTDAQLAIEVEALAQCGFGVGVESHVMELMVRFYGTAERVAKEGLSAAVGYFESGFFRSNDIISIPNSAQQIIPSHQGLKGIGRRNRSMSSQRRHPDGMLLSVFAGNSIFNSFTLLFSPALRAVGGSALPR